MNRISKHITYDEAIKSHTAIRYNIDNTPDEDQLKNMVLLADAVFEPLREVFNKPIAVVSFFRVKALNSKLGGSKTSQHMAINGAAIDIDANVYGGMTNIELFNYIRTHLVFDQLIAEFPDHTGEPAWIHISYKHSNNRKQIFIALKDERGRTIYRKYDKRLSL
jgi:hypothetical protein